MQTVRAPWWMYVIAAVYTVTLFFNARQEAWGPANTGWTPAWPTLEVAGVQPNRPMESAGLRVGDVLETVDGQPLRGMPDWFLARAHFERGHQTDLQVLRGQQKIALQFMITEPSWRTWNRAHFLGEVAFYLVRFLLLILAMLVGFSHPDQLGARLAALMLAVAAVAEGYPSSGWAAGLRHLPAALAIPICMATISCLLASVIWLAFFASFPRPQLSQRRRWVLTLVPLLIFGIPMVASAIAMIYAPTVLARPWPLVFSAVPVRVIQDIAGVTPLLFFNVLPLYHPSTQATLLELWFAASSLYFAAGFLMLAASYRPVDGSHERRRAGALCLAVIIFGSIVVHNVLMRNWTNWFGSPPPWLFSGVTSFGEDILFLFVPLTLAYAVLTEGQRGADRQAQSEAAEGPM
jgi:hypothetical protein